MTTTRVLIGFVNGVPKLEGNLNHVQSRPVDYDSDIKWVKTEHVFSENLEDETVYWKFTIEEFPTRTVPAIGDKILLNKVTKKITVTYD